MKFPTRRLAIVATHPVQYYAPWFVHLERHLDATIRVFYLWNFGVTSQMDRGFGHEIKWDIDLLGGYPHQFVNNQAADPGSHHFFGLINPGLIDALLSWKPDALLLFGYRSWSHLQLITSRRLAHLPFLFRGDSHLLAEPQKPPSRLIKRLTLRIIFRRFTAFLPVGAANTEYFLRHGVPVGRLHWAGHAVENERFSNPAFWREGAAWKRDLKIPEDHRLVLFAGKFEDKKRPDDLIRAFQMAAPEKTTLLLVGAGTLENKLRKMAAGHSPIRFAPFQNQGAMPRVYAAADLVVLPSCGHGETWGLVINEALSAGKAVIVSDHVGCHLDLVETGRNGLVFPAGDVEALSECLREALGPKICLRKWGEAGRKKIANFSYAHTTRGLDRALDQVWDARNLI